MATILGTLWRNHFVILGTGQQYEWYLIAPDTTIIYHGIAYKRPGEINVIVKVNDLCASWMRTPTAKAAASEEFKVTLSSGVTKETFAFLYDWSYEAGHDTVTQGMLAPISRHLSRKQLFALSQYNAKAASLKGYRADGTYKTLTLTAGTASQYKTKFGWDFALPYGQAKISSIVSALNDTSLADVVAIEYKGVRYEMDDECARYALYYMNAYGGWETLLLRGHVSFSEGYQRRIYTHDYDNGNPAERGEVNFMNEVEVDMTLRTGWLTDTGAANIGHLTGSTWVYLYDMDDKQFTPLVLTDASVDRKSYRGEGAAMVSYSINARVARERMRL